MTQSPLTVIIRYQVQPGKASQALREFSALIEPVVTHEPACLGIALLQAPGDDTRFLLYERWADRATYTGPHMQTPHLQAFIRKAPAFLAGRPDISLWRAVSEARGKGEETNGRTRT